MANLENAHRLGVESLIASDGLLGDDALTDQLTELSGPSLFTLLQIQLRTVEGMCTVLYSMRAV